MLQTRRAQNTGTEEFMDNFHFLRESFHFFSEGMRRFLFVYAHVGQCVFTSAAASELSASFCSECYWVLGLTCLEWHELVPDEVCPWGKA